MATFDLRSGQIRFMGSGSVVSGTIGSGQIGANHLGSGSVLSGHIASGQVGQLHIASGAVSSGRLATTGTPDGTLFLRDDFAWTGVTVSLGSGNVGSGKIASGAVQGFFGVTRHITSGSVGSFDLGSGAVVAGSVGSGAIVSGNVASGQIGSFHIASGQLTGFELGSGAIVSGRIASGQIGSFHIASGQLTGFELGSGAIVSGRIASGQIGGFHLADSAVASGDIASGSVGQFVLGSGAVSSGHINSGNVITYSRNIIDDTMLAGQAISGRIAVTLGSGGQYVVPAERQSGFRLPAIGVSITNAASGDPVTIVLLGMVHAPSSGTIASGVRGGLYVGSGGLLVNLSGFMGGASSGPGMGMFSGSFVQYVGQATSGGIFVNPSAGAIYLITLSGLGIGTARSGQYPVSGFF